MAGGALTAPPMAAMRTALSDRCEMLWRYTDPAGPKAGIEYLCAHGGLFQRRQAAHCGLRRERPAAPRQAHHWPFKIPPGANLFTLFHRDLARLPVYKHSGSGCDSSPMRPSWASPDGRRGAARPRAGLSQSGDLSISAGNSGMDWTGERAHRAGGGRLRIADPSGLDAACFQRADAGAAGPLAPGPPLVADGGHLFHIVLMWKVGEVMFPSQWWWGGFYLPALGYWLVLDRSAFLQLLVFPPVAAFLDRSWRPASRWINRHWRAWHHHIAISVAVCALTGVAACYWSEGFMGMATSPLAFPGYEYHNPLAAGLYYAFRMVVVPLLPGGTGSRLIGFADLGLIPWFILGWLPFYVLALALLARLLGRTRREAWMVFCGLLSLKILLVQFGYVEVYGPAAAVQAWVIFLILAAFRNGPLTLATIFPSLAICFIWAGRWPCRPWPRCG